MTETEIQYCLACTEMELKQILLLQKENLSGVKTAEVQSREGFVTVEHDLTLLSVMNSSAQQVIAKAGERVVGYALVMRPELRSIVPVLVPMFNLLESLYYKGKLLSSQRYYVMGQICVGESHRRMGVFDGMYHKHKEVYSGQYDLCVTEISTRNLRSMRAHQRVGFKTIHTFRDETDEWNIVLWDWTASMTL
jgi:hypothetical protein